MNEKLRVTPEDVIEVVEEAKLPAIKAAAAEQGYLVIHVASRSFPIADTDQSFRLREGFTGIKIKTVTGTP